MGSKSPAARSFIPDLIGMVDGIGAIFAMKAFLVDGKSAEESLAIGKSAGVEMNWPLT